MDIRVVSVVSMVTKPIPTSTTSKCRCLLRRSQASNKFYYIEIEGDSPVKKKKWTDRILGTQTRRLEGCMYVCNNMFCWNSRSMETVDR